MKGWWQVTGFKEKWDTFWDKYLFFWWGVPVVSFALRGEWVLVVISAFSCLLSFMTSLGDRLNRIRTGQLNETSRLVDEQIATAESRHENLNNLSDSLAEWDRQLTERERRLDAATGRARHVN